MASDLDTLAQLILGWNDSPAVLLSYMICISDHLSILVGKTVKSYGSMDPSGDTMASINAYAFQLCHGTVYDFSNLALPLRSVTVHSVRTGEKP